jgi:alkylhydroperoxidase/carboxymuconolactone decarboxylase family protein YurZ
MYESMTLGSEHRELLRRLTLNDEKTLRQVISGRDVGRQRLLDDQTRALVKLAGLVALEAEIPSLQVARDEVWATGAGDEEIVDTVLAVAPIVGTSRIASTAPRLTIALERD